MAPLMAVEILFVLFLVAKSFERKEYFYVRFFGGAFVCVFVSVVIEILYSVITGKSFIYGTSDTVSNVIFKILYYVSIVLMVVLCSMFSFEVKPLKILAACSVAYAFQHMAANTGSLLAMAANAVFKNNLYAEIFALVFSRLAVYIPMYFLFKERNFQQSFYKGNDAKKAFLFLMAILVCIFLSRLSGDDPKRSVLAKIAEPLYAIMCSIFIIFVQTGLSDNDIMHVEAENAKELLRQEREQYKLSKENIKIINEKCHDLKHQILRLKINSSDEDFKEVEQAVMIYDCGTKTGSDALDVILTEKRLQCEAKKITFTTAVNGKLLSFMSETDIYSLFGNMISNAIEAVSKIEDAERRHIALKVYRTGDICSIHSENYYDGELSFVDGLPETKKNKDYHGFGMHSMERTVERYGGMMSVTAKNGVFFVDMAFPIDD